MAKRLIGLWLLLSASISSAFMVIADITVCWRSTMTVRRLINFTLTVCSGLAFMQFVRTPICIFCHFRASRSAQRTAHTSNMPTQFWYAPRGVCDSSVYVLMVIFDKWLVRFFHILAENSIFFQSLWCRCGMCVQCVWVQCPCPLSMSNGYVRWSFQNVAGRDTIHCAINDKEKIENPMHEWQATKQKY